MKKLYLATILSSILIITGCAKSSENTIDINNIDNTFVMTKNKDGEDKYVKDVYIKYLNKDEEKIASNIPYSNDIKYVNSDKSIYIQDLENNLYKYTDGQEKELIGKELIDLDYEYDLYLKSFDVSKNGKTVAYLTEDKSLYIKFPNKDKEKIASNICTKYVMDDEGEYIYYLNEDNDFYSYNINGEKNKIASDVEFFRISNDGSTTVYLNKDKNLYKKDILSDEKIKIDFGDINIYDLSIYKDKNLVYLNDFNYEKNIGELYLFTDTNEKVKIASDVKDYYKVGNEFYYLNADNVLYKKSINDSMSNKIASDVEDFYADENMIAYLNNDGELYKLEKNKESVKVGNDIEHGYSWSIINKKLIYINKNNELFIDGKNIDKEILTFSHNGNLVYYVKKDNKLYSYDIENEEIKIEIDNVDKYSDIYLGEVHFFTNLLNAYELVGYWRVKSEVNDEYLLEINESGKLIFYSNEDGKLNKEYFDYELINNSENYISMVGKGEWNELYIDITREDANNITLNVGGTIELGERISNSEADKIKKQRNNINTSEINNQVNWTIADSSSVLNDGNNISYSPSNVLDSKTSTVWSEGVQGDGIGEWIEISTGGDIGKVNSIAISNGFTKSTDLYYKNNRIKKANLEFSDGTNKIVEFKDNTLDEQVIDIGGKETSYVRLTILEVYKGNKYQDTCISTISINKISSNNDVQQEFTGEDAIRIAKKTYGDDEDTVYQYDSEPIYTETGKHYRVILKSNAMMKQGGSGTLFSIIVSENGNVTEE